MPFPFSTDSRYQPEMRNDAPTWFHYCGRKMSVRELDTDKRILFVSASAAELTISQPIEIPQGYWLVEWKIVQSQHEKSAGQVIMTSADLRSAFGLSPSYPSSPQPNHFLFSLYGADSALQGCYIRWEKHLNIPCPGTGRDGDPNISIYINSAMREAVQALTTHK